MTAIGMRYLTGYAAATNLASNAPEWPPHPGRVFMALAAAYFETRGGQEERNALLWLEGLAAPSMAASEAQPRTFFEAYVPVNDNAAGVANRPRQPRSFAKTRADEDTVYLIWSEEAPEAVRTGLANLCSKVTRVGHSASLTQLWLAEEDTPKSNWAPEEGLEAPCLLTSDRIK